MQNKKSARLIFISDLHLGAGKANDFHRSFELHRLLDYAAENATELVILGDFLELLQSELTEIYLQHHPLFAHLFDVARKIPVTYVLGNHDALMAVDYRAELPSYFLGSPINVTLAYENRALRLFAEHGHQYDLFNRRADPLDLSEGSTPGDRIARTVGWLEKHLNKHVDTVLGGFEDLYYDYKFVLRKLSRDTVSFASLVLPSSRNYVRLGGDYSEYARGALDVLRSPRYDLVLFGHTHQQFIRRFLREHDGADGLFVNTGSWVGNDLEKSPPVFVEVTARDVKLIDAETYEILEEVERRQATLQSVVKKDMTRVIKKVLV